MFIFSSFTFKFPFGYTSKRHNFWLTLFWKSKFWIFEREICVEKQRLLEFPYLSVSFGSLIHSRKTLPPGAGPRRPGSWHLYFQIQRAHWNSENFKNYYFKKRYSTGCNLIYHCNIYCTLNSIHFTIHVHGCSIAYWDWRVVAFLHLAGPLTVTDSS